MTKLAENIKNALEFYQALGFERLPIKLKDRKLISDRSRIFRTPVSPASDKRESSDPQLREKGKSNEMKEEALKALREEIGDCMRCKLAEKRTHIVFGEGNPDARLMFIGEAPGREEDLQANSTHEVPQ